MAQTVIEHVMWWLKKVGIQDVFGVPGDFSFPVSDAIIEDRELEWVGCTNELNAAYAADGYARIKGISALCTTYGVGELSAINGIAGAYSEYLPIVHLVGMPGMKTQAGKRVIHHSLGNGEFDFYYHMTKPVVCARTILTPENCISEMARVMEAAVKHRRPIYIAIPKDCATMKIVGSPGNGTIDMQSDPDRLSAAIDDILEHIQAINKGVFLPGIMAYRVGLVDILQRLIEKTGFAFATMFHDKSVLDETHPQYVGMYDGQLMNQQVREYVENADLVINVGALWGDFNTGAFTSNLDGHRTIDIYLDHTQVGYAVYEHVYMKDLLQALADRVAGKKPEIKLRAQGLGDPIGQTDDLLTPEYLYPRWEQFLREDDLLICETGTVSMGMGFAKLPRGAVFCNQTLWGAIGWATPAAFGAAMANRDRRLVLITGEGAHQMTATEIGQFAKYNVKPVIFVLNNDGYTIERLLCKEPDYAYNDVAPWSYAKLPEAMGCEDWLCATVRTNGELNGVLKKINTNGHAAYIEVMMDQMAAPPLAKKLGDILGHKG
ncbi:alpha-keto acid decarboxylase family protein [Poriferisphaera sp. WC338]|uniref:alpha-keto acid decarboxylase family protein n=1 Tax=Poriferisphaera sp. WC338 TaxID=3425129 RepID=UPI003D813D86